MTVPAILAFEVPGEILSFVDAMLEAHSFADAKALAYFYEKPWKWEDEYRSWVAHSEPMDAQAKGWEPWLLSMDGVVS